MVPTKTLYTKTLDSPLTGQVLKRLGEPGFYASKFLNYRKQINQPTCTLSEQLNKLSVITALTGDITTHAFDYFETRKLKKKFEAKLSEINKYQQDLKNQEKKILELDNSAPNIQLDSLKLLRDTAKVDLKKAEMIRVFTYTTLGLQVTSKILSMMESTAEMASLGSTLAEENSCKAAKQAQQVADEARVQAILDGKPVAAKITSLAKFAGEQEIPWYLIPFQYLAKGLSFIESSEPFNTISTYRRSADQDTLVKDQKDAQTGLSAAETAKASNLAAYAEDMLVDVITEVISKWKQGKNSKDIAAEINGLDKNNKNDSGLMKIIKQVGVEELAVRYAVRTLIKANIVQVNAFMSSGAGRFVVYGYNIYITYRTISNTEAQVQYAKDRLALLDNTIKEFETKVTIWSPMLNQFFEVFMPTRAFADIGTQYVFPRPPCLKDFLANCKAQDLNLIPEDNQKYFKSLPKEIQESQIKTLSSNYSLKSAIRLATGNTSYEEIDVAKTKVEIDYLEKYSSQLEQSLTKKNTVIAQNEEHLKKMKNENIFPEVLLASYGKENSLEDFKKIVRVNTKINLKPSVVQASIEQKVTPDTQESIVETEKNYNYGKAVIYTKDKDLFEIITNRYQQVYK
ncbi:MAG: hypothetical protein Q7U04_14085 [Bacteriovorax sp.]|nr:hypothetical protein [Bacteriovorax sp.]